MKKDRDVVMPIIRRKGKIVRPKEMKKKRKNRSYNWAEVDWRLSSNRIAKDTGAPPGYVSTMRRKHAPDTMGKNRKNIKPTGPAKTTDSGNTLKPSKKGRLGKDWSAVDWSQKTNDLASRMGVGPAYISIMRRKYAPNTLQKRGKKTVEVFKVKPKAKPEEKMGRKTKKNKQILGVVWDGVDWSQKTTVLAAKLGVSSGRVSAMRAKLAPDTLKFRNKVVDGKVKAVPVAEVKKSKAIRKKVRKTMVTAVDVDGPRQWISVADGAVEFGHEPSTIRMLISRGILPARKDATGFLYQRYQLAKILSA